MVDAGSSAIVDDVSRPTLLPREQLATLTERLPGWSLSSDRTRIRRCWYWSSFTLAMEFMARAAPGIDGLNHHPRWVQVYREVEAELWTHDLGGLSCLDLELADHLDRVAAELGPDEAEP